MEQNIKRLQTVAYDALSDRRQAYVDAIAHLELATGSSPDDPDDPSYFTVPYTHKDIARTMEEEFGEEGYKTDGDATRTLKKRRDIIEERKTVLDNERNGFEGSIKTESPTGTYEGPKTGIDSMMQYIGERPIKDVEATGVEGEIHVTIAMNRRELFNLVRNSDEETAKDLFERIVFSNEHEQRDD